MPRENVITPDAIQYFRNNWRKENIPSFKNKPEKKHERISIWLLPIDWLIDWHIWVLLTRINDVTGSKRRQQQKRLSW